MSNDAQIAGLIARLDALDKKNQSLERLVKDQGSLIPIRQQESEKLNQIRQKSIFAVVDTKTPNRSGAYAVRLYRQDADELRSVVAVSDDDKAQKIADGWFDNQWGKPLELPVVVKEGRR